jgi:hypothetical protein
LISPILIVFCFANDKIYAEITNTLTPSPSPKKGEGNKKNLLLPFWEKGLGDEGNLDFA